MTRQTRTDHRVLAGLLETAASLLAIVAVAALPLNDIGAHLAFFGEQAVIDSDDVRNYWVLVAVLALALAGAAAAAIWRRARWAWVWHVAWTAIGLAAAVVFAVTTTGPVVDQPPRPEPTPSDHGAPPCFSGSGDCPGG